jgi:conjugal transfer pilus assembly protein TraV
MRIDARRVNAFVTLAVAAFLAGCTSLSGVGGEAHYACPAPQGVQCGSVTANYQQSLQRDLPPQPPSSRVPSIAQNANTAMVTAERLANPDSNFGTPLYAPPRILTLWVAPWEDRDNVLHDAAFVHVPIDHGRWLIDHVRTVTRPEGRAIRPPPPAASGAPAQTDASDRSSPPPRSSSPVETQDSDAR